jgi:hypothetical protein
MRHTLNAVPLDGNDKLPLGLEWFYPGVSQRLPLTPSPSGWSERPQGYFEPQSSLLLPTINSTSDTRINCKQVSSATITSQLQLSITKLPLSECETSSTPSLRQNYVPALHIWKLWLS